jgi:hypothetical protein
MSQVVLDPVCWESVEAGDSALIDRWLAAEGDQVRAGQVLAKATLVRESVDVERRTTASSTRSSWPPASSLGAAMCSRM